MYTNGNHFSDAQIGNIGIIFESMLNFRRRTERNIAMHMHMVYEMHILLDGEACITTEQRTYTLGSGEIALISPRTYHSITNITNTFQLMSVSFQLYQVAQSENAEEKQLLDTLEALKRSPVVLLKEQLEIIYNIQKLAQAQNKQELANSYLCNAYATEILVYLFRALPLYLDAWSDTQAQQFVRNTKTIQLERMRVIEEYLELHYKDASITELAKKLYLSTQHTRRFLRDNYGMAFSQLLNRHRINVSKHLLRNSDRSISEIWELAGFHSAQNFSIAFKKFTGCSASEYRLKNSEKE